MEKKSSASRQLYFFYISLSLLKKKKKVLYGAKHGENELSAKDTQKKLLKKRIASNDGYPIKKSS